ncbi:helix-turn-helix transcriptional regulator [Polynucleobacter sp. MWH-UH35A]|uniref:helix-turn-helix domain-containing protein n=1 Tax=Polynucleobacter sp. MWH-UH35A TaxID=1855619 RepID=UPI001BFE9B37|nr:helix-turn-helix transcriptional regulator [Polynucleobacter sp. MWH-UH35A]QWD59780.1 helix-turn-helix transcriptional regulator [Polynucleobacter sp. MWH-UH35A]
MSQVRPPEINGIALKVARENQGMERAELASKCCLSTKMIIELEEGGISSFYNFQLKVSVAKKVGSYLGLSPEVYLQEFKSAVEEVPSSAVLDNAPLLVDEKLALEYTTKSVADDGGQLDDLIYESTNSGTSLPHVESPVQRSRWMSVLLVVFVGGATFFGLENWFHISDRAIDFLGQNNQKKMAPPEPPMELVVQDAKQIQGDESLEKTEPKSDSSVTTFPQNQCPPVRDDQLTVYKSPNPSKLGDAVNIKTLVKQVVCVTDSNGKQVSVDLESNTAHSFKGAPPFMVAAQDLDNVEMFYQGWRVRPPNVGMKQMKLVEVPLQ